MWQIGRLYWDWLMGFVVVENVAAVDFVVGVAEVEGVAVGRVVVAETVAVV